MHSLQAKNTLLTVCAIIVAFALATLIGVYAVKSTSDNRTQQLLRLLCETGEKNLDYYFDSVEQSADTVAYFAHTDLAETAVEDMDEHVERVRDIFVRAAAKTSGVLTFYYRIDPEVSAETKGFWYVDLTGDGFVEHEVTDITLYDTDNTSELVWFTVPKSTGKAIWLPSYITDNLDVRVISYNIPIYRESTFVGVIGIEVDYTTMANQVDNIQLYDNGYAYLNDDEGDIVYHPRIDVFALEEKIKVPDGMLDSDNYITYTYEGVKKKGYWLPLRNGLRLNVAVPVSEINAGWLHMIDEIIIAASVALLLFVILTVVFTRHFTKPLRKLTEAAKEVNAGNYDVKLDYKGNDEVGTLTQTVAQLIDHLKGYIADLNSLAYGDALTSVRNKGAFDIHIRELQTRIDNPDDTPEFAVAMFDCDDLKSINDRYGHENGNVYLKNSCHLICRVFHRSSVYRVGGDEFAVILQNDDYKDRELLARRFLQKSAEICSFANEKWEEIQVAIGVATYDPKTDSSVIDVIRRADRLMYENKRAKKNEEPTKTVFPRSIFEQKKDGENGDKSGEK